MRYITLLLATCFLLSACSVEKIEKMAFLYSIKTELTKLCDGELACEETVQADSETCAEQANWREYVDAQDEDRALRRFQKVFFACLVDDNGTPYFEIL